MLGARIRSKAAFLPEIETPRRNNVKEKHSVLSPSRCIEITGFGEGCLSLARLSRGKYLALLAIGVLAALLPYS